MNVINMFNKGNFERRYVYYGEKDEPAMAINNHASRSSALIPLTAAYKYDEPEAHDQQSLADHFDMIRKTPLEGIFKTNYATMLAMNRIANEDLSFGIALGLYKMAVSLGVNTDNTSLFHLREYIADGLDDLVKMKPFSREKTAVAEFEATIDGKSISGEIME